MAMDKLETMYNCWTWELRSHVLDLQNQLTSQIQNEEFEGIKPLIENQVVKKHKAIKQEFERYFRENKEREILALWQGRFEDGLKSVKGECIKETLKKCGNLISIKKIDDFLRI